MKSLRSLILKVTMLLLVLVCASATTYAQGDKGITEKQALKMQAKKDKEKAKAKKKADRDARKRHLSIQSKDVRKRMRKNTNRANRKGSGRHVDPFYKRWFKSRK